MIIYNNSPKKRWVFYTIDGITKKVPINSYEKFDVPEITSIDQIKFDSAIQAERNRQDFLGTELDNKISVIENTFYPSSVIRMPRGAFGIDIVDDRYM